MKDISAWLKKNGFTWKTVAITVLAIIVVVLLGSLYKYYKG